MSYLGRHLTQCFTVPFDWHDTWLVVVSGDGPNVFGHALLRAGMFYFHIAGLHQKPYYMSESGYRTYLTDAKKHELFRRQVFLPSPQGAQRKLEELSAKPWLWLGIPNNCVSYVEALFRAGGTNDSLLSNCPVRWR